MQTVHWDYGDGQTEVTTTPETTHRYQLAAGAPPLYLLARAEATLADGRRLSAQVSVDRTIGPEVDPSMP